MPDPAERTARRCERVGQAGVADVLDGEAARADHSRQDEDRDKDGVALAVTRLLWRTARESVYQSKDDPNDVLVLHTFTSAEEAERFVASPELRDAIGRAGVEGAPRVEIFEEARRLART